MLYDFLGFGRRCRAVRGTDEQGQRITIRTVDHLQLAQELQDSLERFALGLPESWMDTPWGEEHVTKVRKKIFASYSSQDAPSLTVKLDNLLAHGRSLPGATPSGYGLGRYGWTSIPLLGLEINDAEAMFDFVEESYRIVAPKTLVKLLDATGNPTGE